MTTPTLDHDAIAHTLALRLADDTTWDAPAQLYWIRADAAGTRLDLAEDYSTAIEIMMDRGERLPAAMGRIADQLARAIMADATAPIAPAGSIGVAVRTEAWGIETPVDPAAITDPAAAEAAALAEQAAAGGKLADHPDRVELAIIHAVTTDDQFYWYEWPRGGISPTRRQIDLTTTPPPGNIPRVLRRLARILNRRQAA